MYGWAIAGFAKGLGAYGVNAAILTFAVLSGTMQIVMVDYFLVEGSAMWRVILRISYTGDFGSGLRNRVVPIFQALGLRHTATGTFESAAVDRVQAANHLAQVMQAIANPQQFAEVDSQAVLKHLWVYIDRVV